MSTPARVAVLERSSQPLEVVCARLRSWGCAVDATSQPRELLAALIEVEVDIVLVDAGVVNCMSVVGQLKGDTRTRSVPVVAATAQDAGVVAANALALGADDVLVLPVDDAELYARVRALARLAAMEAERRRREAVLAEFGVTGRPETPGVPAIDRLGILLIGPAGPEQIQVSTALGSAATVAYAETPERALERLRRQDLDVAVVTAMRSAQELQQLCAAIRTDAALFDMPLMLIGRADSMPDRALPFEWGVSDVLLHPFHPEILRLRVQSWVRQQRLRRRLRGVLTPGALPATADRLTQLYTHGFVHAYLEHQMAHAWRSQIPLAVVGLGVAGMRQINRECGYAVGDRVLAQLGAIVARSSRAEDLPARVGGDRFCIVMSGADTGDALLVGERIAAVVAATPVPLDRSRSLRIELCAGVAELAPDDDAETLVARAIEQLQPCGLRQAS